MSQAQELTHDVNYALKELRETVESKTANLSENREKVERIEKHLDKLEDQNQKLVSSLNRHTSLYEELEKKYNLLDAANSTLAGSGLLAANKLDMEYLQEIKALNEYCMTGQIEQKYLRVDSNVDGGFLVPPQFVREIIKKITEISPIRSVALVKRSESKTMEQPIRTTLLSSGWVGEGQAGNVSNSKYGLRRIQIKRLYVESQITVEELQDSAFDMADEIQKDVVEEFARNQGYAFVKGDGINMPWGFMINPEVPTYNSGSASDIVADNFIDLHGQLKTGYSNRAIFGLNRRTIARVRKFKTSGSGEYIFNAGNFAAGVPNSIAGSPYIEIPDMDDIGTNLYPVIYADFRDFYQIADRMSMEVIRDPYTLKNSGKVAFTYYMRVGGDVRQPEAGIKLKCSV